MRLLNFSLPVSSPAAVELSPNLFSVRTSNRDDRCFVSQDKGLWICLHEKCKQIRATYCSSNMLSEFSCNHIRNTESSSPPEASYPADKSAITSYVCSDSIRKQLSACADQAICNTMVVRLSPHTFAVYGPPSASNSIGFCHLKAVTNSEGDISRYICTGKDCRSFFSKAKHTKSKVLCIHLHILSCFAGLSSYSVNTSPDSEMDSHPNQSPSTPSTATSDMPLSRSSTLELYKDRKLPYRYDKNLMREIVKRDSNSALELMGGWPNLFFPDEQNCSLCSSELSPPTSHPGQSGNSYLLTESNAFKKVVIQVKICKNKQCKAMHQVFPIHVGV